MKPITEKDIQRFWKKVDKKGETDCWNWIGCTRGKDIQYGSFRFHEEMISSHRFSFILSIGEIPAGMFICHHCDNGLCVNPNHLFLGTRAENTQDMMKKGRNAQKARHHGGVRKLTPKQVNQIINSHRENKIPCKELSKSFGVSTREIYYILNCDRWGYL